MLILGLAQLHVSFQLMHIFITRLMFFMHMHGLEQAARKGIKNPERVKENMKRAQQRDEAASSTASNEGGLKVTLSLSFYLRTYVDLCVSKESAV